IPQCCPSPLPFLVPHPNLSGLAAEGKLLVYLSAAVFLNEVARTALFTIALVIIPRCNTTGDWSAVVKRSVEGVDKGGAATPAALSTDAAYVAQSFPINAYGPALPNDEVTSD